MHLAYNEFQEYEVLSFCGHTTYNRNLTNNFAQQDHFFSYKNIYVEHFCSLSFDEVYCLPVWIFDGQGNNCFNGKTKISYMRRKQRNFGFTLTKTLFPSNFKKEKMEHNITIEYYALTTKPWKSFLDVSMCFLLNMFLKNNFVSLTFNCNDEVRTENG